MMPGPLSFHVTTPRLSYGINLCQPFRPRVNLMRCDECRPARSASRGRRARRGDEEPRQQGDVRVFASGRRYRPPQLRCRKRRRSRPTASVSIGQAQQRGDDVQDDRCRMACPRRLKRPPATGLGTPRSRASRARSAASATWRYRCRPGKRVDHVSLPPCRDDAASSRRLATDGAAPLAGSPAVRRRVDCIPTPLRKHAAHATPQKRRNVAQTERERRPTLGISLASRPCDAQRTSPLVIRGHRRIVCAPSPIVLRYLRLAPGSIRNSRRCSTFQDQRRPRRRRSPATGTPRGSARALRLPPDAFRRRPLSVSCAVHAVDRRSDTRAASRGIQTAQG